MATITLGGSNGIVWDGNTKTKAQFAAASSNVTTASSNITLDACSFNNKVAASPKFVDINGENGFQGNVTVSSNTEELVIDSNTEGGGLFGVGSVTVNSGVYLYSDDVANAALKITLNGISVSNSGIIMGKGGEGGSDTRYQRQTTAGEAGGPAIEIASGVTGVTITNNSGAYIAGGGGGGGASTQYANSSRAGGGGGAGGGQGGAGVRSNNGAGTFGPDPSYGGLGGSPGGSGDDAQKAGFSGGSNNGKGQGGTAGGGGGNSEAHSNAGYTGSGGGGGGGRIVPGSATPSNTGSYTTGAGGYASNAGGSGHAGGGGGYGASGGSGTNGAAGSGGAAIKDNGQTYTLTNNGTVYGTT